MIVQKSKHCYVAFIDRAEVGFSPTLEGALDVYAEAVKERTGKEIDKRIVEVYQYMPRNPKYKLLRIR